MPASAKGKKIVNKHKSARRAAFKTAVFAFNITVYF
jgi:hypothetical protein